MTYFNQQNMAKVTLYRVLKLLCSSLWNPLTSGAEAHMEEYMKRGAQASQLSRPASWVSICETIQPSWIANDESNMSEPVTWAEQFAEYCVVVVAISLWVQGVVCVTKANCNTTPRNLSVLHTANWSLSIGLPCSWTHHSFPHLLCYLLKYPLLNDVFSIHSVLNYKPNCHHPLTFPLLLHERIFYLFHSLLFL